MTTNRADRLFLMILALVLTTSSLLGLHFYSSKPDYSHPVRWSPEVGIVLDSDSYQFEVANQALAAWSPALPKATSTSQDGNIHILLQDSNSPRVGGEAQLKVEDRWITGCTIVLRSDLLPELVLPTLTHEMGHCLGLDHNPAQMGASIMYYDMGGWKTDQFSFEMTARDLHALKVLYR